MLERLRGALTQQHADLHREIAAYGADPGSDDVTFEADTGFSDRSHSTEERARVIAVVRALRSNLHDVDRALAKMDAPVARSVASAGSSNVSSCQWNTGSPGPLREG